MADPIVPKPLSPPAETRAPRPGRRQRPILDIESLRVRLPARDASEGRAMAADLAERLGAESPLLLAGARSTEVGEVRLSLTSARGGDIPGAATSAIVRTLSRALARGAGPREGR